MYEAELGCRFEQVAYGDTGIEVEKIDGESQVMICPTIHLTKLHTPCSLSL
jgi:hypothetical protein